MRLSRWAAVSGAIGLALALPLAAPAGAEVTGPCRGTIKGVDVATRSSTKKSDAIVVDKNEVIAVGATANGRLDRYKIRLELLGIKWTVAKGSANGNSWSRDVNVATYARYGVGLYKVSGVSSGGANCTGAALVRVRGSAFGSVAGITAVALSVIGIGAIARGGIQGFICGPKSGVITQSIQSMSDPVTAIVDIKTPRDYVNTVQAICTYNPSLYAPFVQNICGNFRPQIQRTICWG
jgi:hypothetical protein